MTISDKMTCNAAELLVRLSRSIMKNIHPGRIEQARKTIVRYGGITRTHDAQQSGIQQEVLYAINGMWLRILRPEDYKSWFGKLRTGLIAFDFQIPEGGES